jgi:hypothetical protein
MTAQDGDSKGSHHRVLVRATLQLEPNKSNTCKGNLK